MTWHTSPSTRFVEVSEHAHISCLWKTRHDKAGIEGVHPGSRAENFFLHNPDYRRCVRFHTSAIFQG